jgi:HTH-type transcriptional regulator, cell division transcriptional repressor
MSAVVARALARSIRAERSRQMLSQRELADRLGWSQQKVGSIETGARQLYAHELPGVCVALGVPLRKLLDGVDEDLLGAMGV